MFKLVLEKGEEPEIKLPTFLGSPKKQESSRKTSAAAAAAKSLQSCPTLCDPIDGSPPGSPHPWDSLGKNTQNNTRKNLHDPDNHNGVITHLEPDILECEVKWALESITMNEVEVN